ncbi:MAG: penicillin-binding protein activator [Gammaproteobacteria bacterium]|nr:penicillin-binding protein activator [Gammaproteobacteria bacterium]
MKIKRYSVILAAGATLLALLASCSSVDVKPGGQNSPFGIGGQLSAEDPGALIEQGKLTEAAMLYLTIASRASSPQRQDIQLKAIDLLTKDKHFEIADNLLSELNLSELNTHQTTFYSYLSAKVAINARNPKKSQQLLSYVKSEDYSSFASKADILRLSIATYELGSDPKSAILERIALESEIPSEDEILLNQQAIIRGLLTLDSTILQNIVQTEPDSIVRAWIDLSLLVKNSKNPFRLGDQLKAWKEQNPQHPIRQLLIASLAPQLEDEPPKLENIALLLPLSGNFSGPATAIRDGFLANYYAQINVGNTPTVRIYDTGKTDSNILTIYQKAIDNGANIVVGPLKKQAINEIALNANHNVPTLVLNQLDDPDFYSKNFYQFSLSPEDEAVQIAQRAWLDGHNRAAIIFPDGRWGKRVSKAFQDEWEKLGGETVTETDYQSKKNDFSAPIKSLLAIDKSTQRQRDLSKLLRTRLKFEARRRQDIDFVFMAAFPKQARLIPPQLKFFHAAKIPIYATSHSFSGRINRKKDRDLDSVIIGDMPWTLSKAKNDNYKTQIYRTWPNESRKFNRLYAFGTDAYNILHYLNWLRANKQSRLQGTTGELRMNEYNQVMRKLSWAVFNRGKPSLLPATAALNN